MSKTILLTGATDGIGLETAKALVQQGHKVLLHGRNPAKLESVKNELAMLGDVETYVADLSNLPDVEALAQAVIAKHDTLDVLINNAGVLKTAKAQSDHGMDVRFVVNTYAPYVLTQRLLPLMNQAGRVVNLSSAAQAPVDLQALRGEVQFSEDFAAYAQSKLAITMWTRYLAQTLGEQAPVFVAVNPGSLLATKMVKEGFGMEGKDINVGSDILVRAALSDEFAEASGQYFDNDAGLFAPPHTDALDDQKVLAVVETMGSVLG